MGCAHNTVSSVGEREVERAKTFVKAALRARSLLGEDATPTELDLADAQLAEDRKALQAAEHKLRQGQLAARGADLPPELDAETYDRVPIEERRLWHSLVTAAVVVRRAERWREPVADRILILDRDEAPTDSRLIPFVVGLHF